MGVVLGITGGIATGKSTVTAMLSELGAETISADDIAREVLSPGSPAVREVVEAFGDDVLHPDGSIDRKTLADRVFHNPEALSRLNSITHPRIIEIMEQQINAFRGKSGEGDVMAVEIPLLFECGLERLVDKVIVVKAEQETQISRLTTRSFSDDEARWRIAAQAPIEEKIQLADWVITTDGSLEDTWRQVKQVWEQVGRPDRAS